MVNIKRSSFIIILLLQILFLFSCESFDKSVLLKQSFVDKSVQPLNVFINEESIKICIKDSYLTYFSDINDVIAYLKNNLQFESGHSRYSLSIIIRKIESTGGFFNALIPLWFLGIPLGWETVSIDIEAAIVDTKGKVLKTYYANATNTKFRGMYYRHYYQTLLYKSLNEICKSIRDQLMKDAEYIKNI